jgi:hypothetical protein
VRSLRLRMPDLRKLTPKRTPRLPAPPGVPAAGAATGRAPRIPTGTFSGRTGARLPEAKLPEPEMREPRRPLIEFNRRRRQDECRHCGGQRQCQCGARR